jgi:Tfp pilus assembly protein PilO
VTQRKRFDIRQAAPRIALVLGILAAINLAFYVLYVRPVVKEYATLRGSESGPEQIDERREQVADREEFLGGLVKAEDDLRYLRREVLSTRSQRMVAVQSELDDLSKQFGIDLESVSYDNEILVDEKLDRFVTTVPLEGGYSALRRFLQAVEHSSRFLLVERVALGKGKEGGVLLQLNITLATYFNAPEDLLPKKQQRTRRPSRSRA